MPLKYQYTKSGGCSQSPPTQVPVLISLSSYYGYFETPASMTISVNGSNFRDYSQIVFSSPATNIIPTFYSSTL